MSRVPKLVKGYGLDAAIMGVGVARSAIRRRSELTDPQTRGDALRGLGRDVAGAGFGFAKGAAGSQLGTAGLAAVAGTVAEGGAAAAALASPLAPVAAVIIGGLVVSYGTKAVVHGARKAVA